MTDTASLGTSDWQRKADKTHRLAWIIWATAIIAQLFNMFHRVAAAAAVDRIMADFSITATIAGSVIAMYFYIYAALQFPSGILADYLGPRKTITYGCLISSIGSVVFGLAPSLPVLYLGRFLVSLGVSIIFVSMLKLQTEWFPSNRFARMTATGFFVANAGTIIGTTPLALLITAAGWRLSFEIVGIITLVICLACWFVIRNKPADIGLPSPTEIKGGPQAESAVSQNQEKVMHFGKRVIAVLKNKYIWPPFIIGVGLYGTMLVLQGAWGIPYLMQVYSMTRDAAANVLLMIVIGHLVGIVVLPYLSDRLQRRKLPTVVSTLCYLVVWILIVSLNNGKPPVAALYPLLFFLGFFVGVGAVYFAVAKEVVSPRISGMALGLVNMGMFVSIAVFQILVGKMLDLGWLGAIVDGARVYPQEAFRSGFILVCVGVLPAVIGALLLKETHCRDIYSELYN